MQIMTRLVHMFTWLSVTLICISSRTALAQNNASVDPVEARLLNAIFDKLRISPATQWNISGELCSGAAIDSTSLDSFNPAIKCDCTYSNNTLCRITALRLYAMDLVGALPDELWNLTYLTNLNFAQNFFTGPLPAAVSRLTQMQYLSFGINSLSGQLPKELGMLRDLRSLAIGTNNFTGSFPPELGNLTRLEQIYFDSSGISGVTPTSFARLQSLVTVWGSDTRLTGQIPDFIGNWSRLSILRLQGNSFQGTIPSSFSKLTSLTDLRISDLSNASYSLEFVRNMTSLSSLVLRNNNVSGSIPSFLGDLEKLQRLDLSFNSFSGGVPDSLFNNRSLIHLFLGNNKLNGTLPQEKSSNLQTIDVSYNELSGSLPSWVNERNLQINLVANNFNLSDSSNSSLPSGLNCLQRNFPCNRGFPIYYNFSIKCGGQPFRSTDGILYESDNKTLGPATYFTTSSRRWAASNAGLPNDARNSLYIFASTAQFTNTSDSEIFQSARISAGSLRYYGLGLENGNYTVNLHFAEPNIRDTVSWRSLGRRVFDIYVQGNRVERDFDIKKAAGGRADYAVERGYKVNVSENYLEVHLFWAGKGTCCVPDPGVYGPLISAISATPDFTPSVSNNPPTLDSPGKKNQTGLIVGIVVPIAIVGFLSAFAAYLFIQRRRKRRKMFEEDEFLGMEARPYTFSYAELRAATNEFNPANKLGEGGFGPVFMGKLYDERVVAVKQLSVASPHGKSQFVAEIATISAVQHRNLVKLYGCCIEGEKRLLVYEYLENKSLDQALFGRGSLLHLDWATRFEICLGVARGLAYLHEESRLRIVHRDVKASNILLDSDLNPKISDFGLAKLYDDKKTHISTRVAGTIGYLAPEYAMRGHLTEKADVFGFGVVALEIVSGRPNSIPSQEEDKIYLLEWAWNLYENESEIELADQRLREFEPNEMKRAIAVALLCTQTSPASRPSMSRVVAMLRGDTEIPNAMSRPGYLADWQFTDISSFATSTTAASSNGTATASRDDIRYDSSTSITAIASHSRTGDTEPILGEILGDGR